MTLHQRAGTGSLEEVARTALAFHVQFLPMSGAILATPGLRGGICSGNAGPHRANEGLAAYLPREQGPGRIDSTADPEAAAALLLGACPQRAVLALFPDEDRLVDLEGCARDLVKALSAACFPRKPRERQVLPTRLWREAAIAEPGLDLRRRQCARVAGAFRQIAMPAFQ